MFEPRCSRAAVKRTQCSGRICRLLVASGILWHGPERRDTMRVSVRTAGKGVYPIEAASETRARPDGEHAPTKIFCCAYMSMAFQLWWMKRTLIGRIRVHGAETVRHNPRNCGCVGVGRNMDGNSVVDLRPALQ